MKLKLLVLFSLMVNCFPIKTIAQKTIILRQNAINYDLNFENLAIFEDKKATLSFEKVQKQNYLSNLDYAIAHGYSDSRFWFKFKLQNQSQKKWILSIRGTQIDEIEFYEIDSSNKISKKTSGDYYTFSTREIETPHFAFYIDLSRNQVKNYYLSIKSKDTKQFDLYINEERYFQKIIQNYYNIGFLYFGMFLMMIIYNFLLYLSIRDISYLYYVLYILTFALLQLTIIGFATQFLWGDNIWLTNRASNFFIGTSTIYIALFSYKFLNVKVIYPKTSWIYVYLFCSGMLITGLAFLPRSYQINYFVAILAFLHVFFEIAGGAFIWRKGYKPARFYMLAWGVLFIAIFIFTLKVLKILPHNNFTFFILPFGSLMEVILLSFGLGNRINTIEREKTNAQKEVVKLSYPRTP